MIIARKIFFSEFWGHESPLPPSPTPMHVAKIDRMDLAKVVKNEYSRCNYLQLVLVTYTTDWWIKYCQGTKHSGTVHTR